MSQSSGDRATVSTGRSGARVRVGFDVSVVRRPSNRFNARARRAQRSCCAVSVVRRPSNRFNRTPATLSRPESHQATEHCLSRQATEQPFQRGAEHRLTSSRPEWLTSLSRQATEQPFQRALDAPDRPRTLVSVVRRPSNRFNLVQLFNCQPAILHCRSRAVTSRSRAAHLHGSARSSRASRSCGLARSERPASRGLRLAARIEPAPLQ